MIDTTIVIPAYGPSELLIKCLFSITDNTDMSKVEIVVVCNGCDDQTMDILRSFSKTPQWKVRMIWYKEALGFTHAANIGLKHAETPYIILLNTDVKILDTDVKHRWVDRLIDPIRTDSKVAVTGVCEMYFNHKSFIPFFCVGMSRGVLYRLDYLDMAFSPGYCEDADYCFRAQRAGYKTIVITKQVSDDVNKRNTGDFPLYHQGRASFGAGGEALSRKGESILIDRYT